jgi:hypothetical protein
MNISDETLMAFTDGELHGEAKEAVERAMRENPEIEKRIARHRALRERIKLAYSAELSEPVPERLLAAARRAANGTPSGNIVSLDEARAAALARQSARSDAHTEAQAGAARKWWRPLGSIAAGVLLGLGLGYGLWQQGGAPVARNAAGSLVATGQLKAALQEQLVAEQGPGSQVHIGISFLAKSGEYCRSFALAGASAPAGIACHRSGDWQIQALTQIPSGEAAAGYRTAGTELPALLRQSIEAQIQGEPLDQAGESAARQRGWQSATR